MNLIDDIVDELGLPRPDVHRIIASAPARYKTYTIPKRNGDRRLIAHPSRELKAVQRYLNNAKFNKFPVHRAAMGYVAGRNILDNANAHRNSEFILKLDFRNFFPSITAADVRTFLQKNPTDAILRSDIPLYVMLVCWGEVAKSRIPRSLSIGAPTSPALSNMLLFEFDSQLDAAARAGDVTYTRYADDITASAHSRKELKKFEFEARKLLRKLRTPKLTFNEEKTGFYSSGSRRMVTGLIITPDHEVSMGRERKRAISSMIHRSALGQLPIEEQAYLKGMLGFCAANEPEFLSRMRIKYGDTAVDQALRLWIPSTGIKVDR